MKKLILQAISGQDGNISSFRIVWSISVLAIVGSWAYLSISTGKIQPWPLDGITTIGLFSGPGLKTLSEKPSPQKAE